MINETAIGGAYDKRPIKTFNELYETSVWKLIMSHIDEEKRTDGEVAYVVRDIGDLVAAIMEFYDKKNKDNKSST